MTVEWNCPVRMTEEMSVSDADPDYLEGDCLVFAFAISWMTGWRVMGLSDGAAADSFQHFTAVGPDGRAWDAAGPRGLDDAGAAYCVSPAWSEVNAYRLVTTDARIEEAAITRACEDALERFGAELEPHVVRRPAPSAAAPAP